MLYVQLDVNWVDNPKVMEVGVDGAGLHAMALCIAKRMETDGVLHRTHLLRVGGTEELIDRLVCAELLDALDGRRVRIHGWLDRNKSQAEIANGRIAIDATRSARSASGREGNHARWNHPGPVEECEKCNPPDGRKPDPNSAETTWSVAGATPESSQGDPVGLASESVGSRNGSLKTETETEEKSETGDATPGDAPGSLRLVPPPSPAAPAASFEDFWREYPRKAGKGQARKAWDAAVKKHDPRLIAEGATRFARDPNLPEREFIPHPATWIRGERWTDEPMPPRTGTQHPARAVGQYEAAPASEKW